MISFKTYLEEVKEPTGKLKDACWTGYTAVGMKMKNGKKVPNCVPVKEDLQESGGEVVYRQGDDHIEKYSDHSYALYRDGQKQTFFKSLEDARTALDEAAVDAKGHKSSTGGLTQKGRDSYNAKGANLKPPVTTPPSKLDPDSKAAKRRKSFCARMGGMEGPMKKPNGEPTRKALALRKWNC
jgi:hypothetical protein